MKRRILGIFIFLCFLLCNAGKANAMYFADYVYQNARVGQLTGIKKYLKQGLDIDAVNSDRKTALCQSVDAREYQAYRKIRQLGADAEHRCMKLVDENVARAFDRRYSSMYKTTSTAVSKESNTATYMAVGALAVVGAGAALAGGGGGGGGSDDEPPPEVPEKCVDGEKWDGSKCVSICRKDEKWNGNECISTVCPIGEEWNDSENKCEPIVCKDNEKLVGNDCLSTVCETGEQWNDEINECESIVCGENEKLVGNECISTVCETGEQWNDEANECEPIVCGENEKLVGNDCLSTVCETGEQWNDEINECEPIVCGENEKLVGNDCLSMVCETGEQWNDEINECEPIVCGENEKLVGNDCLSTVCSTGEEWNDEINECEPIVCGENEKLVGNDCVSMVCETGEQWNDSENECEPIVCGENEKLVGNDCLSTVCPTGEEWDDETNECEPIDCGENKKLVDGICISTVCPTGEKWDDDTNKCVPIVCPEGTVLVGSLCVVDDDISKEAESEDTLSGISSDDDIFNLYSVPSNSNDEQTITLTQKGNGDVIGLYGTASVRNAYVVGKDGDTKNPQDIGRGNITITSEGSGVAVGLYSRIEDKRDYKEVINAQAWNEGTAYGTINVTHNGSGDAYGIFSDVRAYNAYAAFGGKAYGDITIHGNGDIYGVSGFVIGANAVSPGPGLETIGNINLYQHENADVYGVIVGHDNIPGAGSGGQDLGTWAGFNSQAQMGGQSVGNINIYNYGNKNAYGMKGGAQLMNSFLQTGAVSTQGTINIQNQGDGDIYGMASEEWLYNAYSQNSSGRAEGVINISNSGNGNIYGMYSDVSNGKLYNARVERKKLEKTNEDDAAEEGKEENNTEDAAEVTVPERVFREGSDGTAIGTISISNKGTGDAYGMYGRYILYNAGVDSSPDETEADGTARGSATINILNANSGNAYGMYLSGSGGWIYNLSSEHEKSVINIVNAGDGTAVGLYGGKNSFVENSGEININNLGKGLAVGMYGDTGAILLNSGTINIYRQTYTDEETGEVYEPDGETGGTAYGIYAKSGASIHNTGTITITGAEIQEEVHLENNATFYNDGDAEFYEEDGKTLKKAVNLDSVDGDIVLGKNGRFFADEFTGNMAVSEQVVLGSLEKEYTVDGALQAKKVDDLTLKSQSAMFATGKRENEDGGFDVVLRRRDLKDILDNTDIGQFYDTNYELGNNVGLFDELKQNKSDEALIKTAANFSGTDVLPWFRKEDALVYKHLSKQFNDSLFNKPEENYIGGYKYIDISAEEDGTLTESNGKANAAYGMLKGTADNGITYGLGATVTHLESDYDTGASRKSNSFGLWLPVGYDFGSAKWFSMLYAGYADGDYKRKTKLGKYSADIDEYQYGLTNEARLKINLKNGFNFEPLAELNLFGIYQNGFDEGEQDSALRVDSGNSLSLEGGLGAYLSKEFFFGDKGKLGLQIGGVYYVEFLNPDDGYYAAMNGMNNRYKLKSKFKDNYMLLSFSANYTYNDLMLYAALSKETDGSKAFTIDTGLQYKF